MDINKTLEGKCFKHIKHQLYDRTDLLMDLATINKIINNNGNDNNDNDNNDNNGNNGINDIEKYICFNLYNDIVSTVNISYIYNIKFYSSNEDMKLYFVRYSKFIELLNKLNPTDVELISNIIQIENISCSLNSYIDSVKNDKSTNAVTKDHNNTIISNFDNIVDLNNLFTFKINKKVYNNPFFNTQGISVLKNINEIMSKILFQLLL